MRIRRLSENRRLISLRSVSLFAQCSNKELRRIDRLTADMVVESGHVLTLASQPGGEFFVIVNGTATVWSDDMKLDSLGPGSFFGEVALLDRGGRTATVVAETDMHLLVMSRAEFRSSHFLVASVMEQMLNELSRRLRRADEGWVAKPAETSETRLIPS